MTGYDYLYAQNWVEQFKERQWSHHSVRYAYDSPSDMAVWGPFGRLNTRHTMWWDVFTPRRQEYLRLFGR